MTPFALLHMVWQVVPKFRNYQQQDAQEFLCYLRDGIHTELLKSFRQPTLRPLLPRGPQEAPERTIIEEIFEGRLVSEVTCLACKTISRREEALLELSLDIPLQHLAAGTRRRADDPLPECSLHNCLVRHWVCCADLS